MSFGYPPSFVLFFVPCLAISFLFGLLSTYLGLVIDFEYLAKYCHVEGGFAGRLVGVHTSFLVEDVYAHSQFVFDPVIQVVKNA